VASARVSVSETARNLGVIVYSQLTLSALSAGLQRRSSSAALCQLKDMCRQKDLQQLWRQILCCCRSEAVEQSASSSETN